jgi:type IV pilus assembly protein PilF
MRVIKALGLALLLAGCTQIVEVNGHKVDRDASAQDHVQIASEFMQRGDDEHALMHLQRALELNPDSAQAHSLLGLLLQREGDVAGAEKNFRKAVSDDDTYSPAHNNYGAFLFGQGRYKEAVTQLQKAADDLSYNARDQALVNLGRASVKTGDLATAETAFARAMRVHPDMPEALLEMADLQFTKGNTVAAHDLYQHFLQLTGNAIQSARTLWLGIRLERIFGDKNALSSYELALKNIYPESPEYKAFVQSQAGGTGS